MSTTIDGVAQILNQYTRKGKAIPAEVKASLGKVVKLMKLIADNLDKVGEACAYKYVPSVSDE
jgi:phage tail tape-measure protein